MEYDSRRKSKSILLLSLCVFAAVFAGCKKEAKATPPSAAPIPPPVAPTVTLNAAPSSIAPGGTARLQWSSTSATDLDIEPGVGKVAPQGSTPVMPATSTSYTITATGSGGTASASALVSVSGSGAASQPVPSGPPNVSELFAQNVKDAYFNLDSADLRDDARAALTKDAEFLRTYPSVHVSIEGHCDERGSTEYNLGLGQRRASAAKNYLISLGISADRMDTTSWGKERPVCTEHDEACWQQNRRGHLVQSR